jgi:hypothetical protein
MAESPTRAAWIALGVLLAAVGGAAYGMVVWFEAVPASVKAPFITGVATVLVALVTVVGARYLDRRQQTRQAIREKNLPIYERFVRSMLDALKAGANAPTTEANPELLEVLNDFSRDLVVWGSDEIVTAWSIYLRGWRQATSEAEKLVMLLKLEDLLTAIRKECGHKGPLAPRVLLNLFLSDIDAVVAATLGLGDEAVPS